ncbi:hypothetical protein PWT90_03966 [Aphanocladium album]|nr:hypothetical protein PWT90_03966 [Aphanocladium album]
MLSKFFILGLAAIGTAMPSPADEDTTQTLEAFESADNLLIDARAPPTKWEAKGGCRTDWGGNCLNQCKKEAKQKGQTCKLGTHIWKSECWLGWCVCDCFCKR